MSTTNRADSNMLRRSLKAGASLLVLGGMLAVPGHALAQDNPVTTEIDDQTNPESTVPDGGNSAEAGNAIIVTGIRAQLESAQNIKRDSDTVVDAITAQDIGALPDRSVTEALQRVPGVAINRFAASNNPDRFSLEGSGVVIRGLNFVRSEFNGRDAFSATGSQSLGFADVPAELLGSVIVAKNLTAEMIEGGLAGTVNLNTRVPFDNRGFHFGGTAEVNYADFRDRWSPNISVLASNTFDTDAGTFGLLGSVSYSQVFGRADGIRITNFQTRDGATVAGANDLGLVVRQQLPGRDLAYAPIGGGFVSQTFDRERTGIAAAAQFESIDRRLVATLQYIRSETSNDQGDFEVGSGGDLAEYNTFPADGTDYTYDDNNVFQSGFITFPGTGYRDASSGTAGSVVPTGGIQTDSGRRQIFAETRNQDLGFNLKFNPTDRLALNFDAQYAKASIDSFDFGVNLSNFADYQVDLSGDVPSVLRALPQNTRAEWAAPNVLDDITSAQYFTDPRFTFWRSAIDHGEQSEGEEYAVKADLQYTLGDESFLKRVKFGARYADRDTTIRNSTYNWGVLSEVWGGNAGTAVFLNEFGGNRASLYDFPNFFRGKSSQPTGAFFYNGDLLTAYSGATQFLRSVNDFYRFGQQDPAAEQGPGWRPIGDRPGTIDGSFFLQNEIQEISQRDAAAYVMLSFGNDQYVDTGLRFSGNIGVRYVNTRTNSDGNVVFGSTVIDDNGNEVSSIGGGASYEVFCAAQELVDRDGDGVPDPAPPRPLCDIGPAAYAQTQAFLNGGETVQTAQNDYGLFLPALNLKLEITPKLQVRFAASRAIARPEFNLIRNFLPIGTDNTAGFRFNSNNAGNPFLQPAKSDQFDLSAEWYFARVGSLTVTAFYKSVKDFFFQSAFTRQLTNNGITQTVNVVGPANFSDERGEVKGLEAAYQQTFDFLPGFLSGLGFQGNYTYIESSGIPNALLDGANPSTVSTGNLPLEQLSKHNFNATGFYEKGPLSLRASYNWRSRFLLTSRDVIFPNYPIYNASAGYLDASVFFNITQNVKLSIQGTNLLNTITRTEQQFSPTGLSGPRTAFINDRRFAFGVRANF